MCWERHIQAESGASIQRVKAAEGEESPKPAIPEIKLQPTAVANK
jgi:hypothetical protein